VKTIVKPLLSALMMLVVLAGCMVLTGSARPLTRLEGNVTLMPMGDSITGSTGHWRCLLWTQLRDAGYHVNFLGERTGHVRKCDVPGFDDDNNGYSGMKVTKLAKDHRAKHWMLREHRRVDIVLLHLGSNDFRHGKELPEIMRGFDGVLKQIRSVNPRATVLVAQPIPMGTRPMYKSCPRCPEQIKSLDDAIPQWVKKNNNLKSPVIDVDQTRGFDVAADTTDELHPTDATGNPKIARRWFNALKGVLDQE
jgi:lysophospholipase L1-like esterase